MLNAFTIDVIYGGGNAGQTQDSTIAAVHILNDVFTQLDVDMEKKQHANNQQRDDPGQRAADVQTG